MIVVGSGGQDGTYLAALLRERGHEVIGVERRGELSILDGSAWESDLRRLRPAAIYYLAAYHHSSEDKEALDDGQVLRRSVDVHVVGVGNVLEAVRRSSPATRMFYAASSHLFATGGDAPITETTPLSPSCLYGLTKTAGVHCCRYYRQSHGLHVSVGYLFNHESPLRKPCFLSRKVVSAAVRISRGSREKLVLGDLSSRVDWGWAPDYVDAMTRMMALPEPDELIVATGETHSVRELARLAFGRLGLDADAWVEERAGVLVKRLPPRCGDSARLRARTGWRPTVTFTDMVGRLVDAEAAATSG